MQTGRTGKRKAEGGIWLFVDLRLLDLSSALRSDCFHRCGNSIVIITVNYRSNYSQDL